MRLSAAFSYNFGTVRQNDIFKKGSDKATGAKTAQGGRRFRAKIEQNRAKSKKGTGAGGQVWGTTDEGPEGLDGVGQQGRWRPVERSRPKNNTYFCRGKSQGRGGRGWAENCMHTRARSLMENRAEGSEQAVRGRGHER